MRLLLAASALLWITACGTTYTHPTKSLQDFDRDKAACEQEAKKALAKTGQANDSCAILDETKHCLETRKGWVRK
jgi:hypothetical protein